jgi:hypothetical protein
VLGSILAPPCTGPTAAPAKGRELYPLQA